ncbi:MAG TPA: 23S rRNA (adenine(2503)-C(2))-methyltransferase RlmN [Ignavibacteria bacterium]|nr:23S rRNA (adenine(2503)-C(2))-methyltransferase RlmN [Bacteroidota bacterium]HRE12128.1 23S rRNA (adenine(2503)-C(2))-methyltransferase RlmN [Ignavibacteria bacterium]HRF64651.1 23S rRNA (adenine(2503)-C(2))-methyltransferase RlmN [Ignavibacteria bacterium]HRJ04955.1 23S rRNA (adenine(2503)-C(2))-methyltransferase RlmN [Ignavibacteria bacterium]
MINKKPFLFDLTLKELTDIITGLGEPAYRAKQVYEQVYSKAVSSFDKMNGLPKSLREKLAEIIDASHLTTQIDKLSSDNHTRKILFGLPDGAQVETVLMGYNIRRTACISTQAGCALGCTFCATGQGGLQRNISSGEIVQQVMFFERELRKKNDKLTNLVFMGMGEPFANYNEVMKAIDTLTDPNGFNFGARRITISTVGLVPYIDKFAMEQSQVNLAVSLHAATDELRETMLPINKRYPLKELIKSCRNYVNNTHRRISFEWALIDHVNDTTAQAEALAALLKGMLCHVNFIPLNPTKGYGGHESKRMRISRFMQILDDAGIPNTLRIRRGIDINAGCGQLRQETEIKK